MYDIVRLILAKARLWPERTAILRADRAITYGMLVEGVASVRRALSKCGLDRSRAVGLFAPDSGRQVILSLALMAEGYCCVVLPRDLLDRAAEFDVDVVLADKGAEVPGNRALYIDASWFERSDGIFAAPVAIAADAIVRVEFTSGSTGISKPIGFTQRSIFANARDRLYAYPPRMTRTLSMFETWSNIGICFMLNRLVCGACVGFASSNDEAIDLLNYFATDSLIGSPIQVARLIGRLKATGRKVEGLRDVVLAGSPTSARELDDIRTTFGAAILIDYGATETGLTAICPVRFPLGPDESAWALTPLREIEVYDADVSGLPGVGKLRIRSDSMGWPFTGRLVQTEADRGDGWFYPGDLGFFTDDGRLVLRGRADSVLNLGGVKMSADTLEAALRHHPGLIDVAVGAQSPDGTFQPTVFVVRTDTADPMHVKTWITAQLPKLGTWKIVEVPSIPRTPTGKIARQDLRALHPIDDPI